MSKNNKFIQVLVLLLLISSFPSAIAEDSGLGKKLYESRCAMCHGVDARATGPLAQKSSPPTPDLTSTAFQNRLMTYPGVIIASIVLTPNKEVISKTLKENNVMLPKHVWTDDELKAINQYVLNLIAKHHKTSSDIVQDKLIVTRFIGIWKLVSITRKNVSSGASTNDYGLKPVGYLDYSPNGRMMTIIVKDNRKKILGESITPQEALVLLNSMTSYAGTYTIVGDQIIHHVDISWNQSWTGTDQKRFYKFDEKYLILTTPRFVGQAKEKFQFVLKWEKMN